MRAAPALRVHPRRSSLASPIPGRAAWVWVALLWLSPPTPPPHSPILLALCSSQGLKSPWKDGCGIIRRLSRKEEGSRDSPPVISSTIHQGFELGSPLSPLPGFLLFPSFIRGRTGRWLSIAINQPISRPPLKPRVSSATRSTWTRATFSTAPSCYLLVGRSESLISVGLRTLKSLPMQSLVPIGRPTLSASAAGFLTSMGISPTARRSSLLSSRLYQMVRLARTPMSKTNRARRARSLRRVTVPVLG